MQGELTLEQRRDRLAAARAALSGFETTALRRRTLRGIGQVTPSELRRAGGGRTSPPAPGPPRDRKASS